MNEANKAFRLRKSVRLEKSGFSFQAAIFPVGRVAAAEIFQVAVNSNIRPEQSIMQQL